MVTRDGDTNGDTNGGTDGDDVFFQLRAGEDGVEQGEEVTISYGPWPNDPFFLYFGFVPEGNPNDAVVLFDELGDVAACAARLDMMSIAEAGERAAAAAAAWDEEEKNGGSGAPTRMVITREGIDEGVMRAAAALGLDGTDAFNALLEGRCKELLREYPTKLKEDRGLLMSGTLSENEFTSHAVQDEQEGGAVGSPRGGGGETEGGGWDHHAGLMIVTDCHQ